MSDWHVSDELLARYVAGRLVSSAEWAVEAHVTACRDCRGRIPGDGSSSGLVGDSRLEAIWDEVELAVDAPVPTVFERGLRRVGVPAHVARLLAATPSLSVSWLGAVVLVLASSVVVAVSTPTDGRLLWFLVVAPLLPVAGIAGAYGTAADPAHEVGRAAPMRSGRLLLLRSVAVLATTVPVAVVASLWLPTSLPVALGWVLPSLAVTAVTLALCAWLVPVVAAGVTSGTWLAVVLLAATTTRSPLAAFYTGGQLTAMVCLALGVAAAVAARDRFDMGGPA